MANILAKPLVGLCEHFSKLVKLGGQPSTCMPWSSNNLVLNSESSPPEINDTAFIC
jgi:hypothetical protein